MKKRWQELFLALGLNMEAYKESAEVNNAGDRDEE
jgi:hypothetical protein